MHPSPRRLSQQALVVSSTLAWGLVEVVALLRQRWVLRREQRGH